jgi:glutathione S-transferase
VVPHEQELELYHYAESLCSQKARIGLAEKALDYESRHIVICEVAEECQNLSEAYLNVNPKGIVPTLVHNGEPVYDAHHIIRYVNEQYPKSGVPLWPSDRERQAIAEKWFEEGMLKENNRYGSNFGMSIPILSHPILANCLSKQPLNLVVEKYRNHPLESRGKRFTALRREGQAFPPEVFTEALMHVCVGLIQLNDLLKYYGGPWLLGEFSLPDITMMACFHRLEDINLDVLLHHERVSMVSAYWDRLQTRTSYKVAIIDWHDEQNWRSTLTELYGVRKSSLHDQGLSILSSLAEI